MAIQIRRGPASQFDSTKMVSGELAVSTDGTRKVWATGAAGDSWELANKEDITGGEAVDITYDNTESGLDADNVQTAVDEVAGELTAAKASLNEKADQTGSYETLTAGNAGQLVAKSYTEEKAPYLFRASRSVGDRLREKVVGGTIGWNQKVQTLDSAGVLQNCSRSYNSTTKEATFTPTTYSSDNVGIYGLLTPVSGHKYMLNADIYLGKAANVRFGAGGSVQTVSTTAGSYVRKARVISASSDSSFAIYVEMASAGWTNQTFKLKNVYATDLTLMLGSTIADYVYSLEQSTAGSGVAWLKANGLFTRDWYSYDAGSLQSVKAGSKINTGFNQWDEQWRNGFYDGSTGAYSANANYVSNKNPIHVIGGADYYFNIPTGKEWCAFWYDANNTFISRSGLYASNPAALTAPSNAAWLNFYLNQNYGTTYNHDICINLSNSSLNGQYAPYEKYEYALDNIELRGIPRLSGGVMYWDGDVYSADGNVDVRYKEIVYDGSSDENWSVETGSAYEGANFFISAPSDRLAYANTTDYKLSFFSNVANSASSMQTGCMFVSQYFINFTIGQRVNASTVAAFRTYLASHPITMIYPVTPSTDTADPYRELQTVSEYGTEEFTDYAFDAGTRDIPVPVGHLSKYYPNLRRRIESLPDDFSTLIAPTEAIYKATRNYTSGSLFIVNNVLYKATAAIANGGTITPGTNCSATTLAAVIAAL